MNSNGRDKKRCKDKCGATLGRDDIVNSFEYTAITFDSKKERNIINWLISESTVTYRVCPKSVTTEKTDENGS